MGTSLESGGTKFRFSQQLTYLSSTARPLRARILLTRYGLCRREFGFVLEGRKVVVDDVRVRAVGRSPPVARPTLETAPAGEEVPTPADHMSCYWEGLGRVDDTPVYMLAELKAGHRLEGGYGAVRPCLTVRRGTVGPDWVGFTCWSNTNTLSACDEIVTVFH